MRYLFALITALALASSPAFAMDGIVTDTGDAVTVENGITFSEGATVVVFDADGTAHSMQVMEATDGPDSISVDLVDADTGDAKTIEFMK